MKSQRLIATVLCFVLSGFALARAQDMDTAISKLTEDVAARIKDNGNKKVTVLDFTDLQGNTTELGKYVAEQVTVDFVMTNRSFSVLDRANLKKIMDEHKLTASGLVDPENAKQLGKFAGVDALIIGNVTLVGPNISLTVKIITTETAEVVGGAKVKFRSDDSVQQLLAQPVATNNNAATASDTTSARTDEPAEPPPPKPFGDLAVKTASVQLIPGDNIYGYARLMFVITNMSATHTYGVALNPDYYNRLNLMNSRGDEFKATEVSGIDSAFQSYGGYSGAVTDISPNSSITIVSKSQVHWNGEPGEYRPYHLQTEVVFGEESMGRHPNLRKFNLVMDIN